MREPSLANSGPVCDRTVGVLCNPHVPGQPLVPVERRSMEQPSDH